MKQAKRKAAAPPMRPNVFAYNDHRSFLRHWVRYLAESEGGSLRAVARKAGLSSAYLPLVLAGKRRLSTRSLERLLPQLGLNDDERRQLELLVHMGESQNARSRHIAVEALQRHPSYRQSNPTEGDVFEYLSHWHYVVVREMAMLPDFRLEAQWVQERLAGAVTLLEVRRALRFLLEKGFLEETPDGGARVRERNLECIAPVFGAALRQFHRGIADATFQSLDETPRDVHQILGHTMAFPKAAFPRLQAILAETIAKVRALEAECSAADSIYHVTVLATPVATTPVTKRRKSP